MKHKISRHSGYPDDAQYFKSTGRRYRCREVRAEEAKLHLGRDATKDEMANGVVILGKPEQWRWWLHQGIQPQTER